MRRKEGKAWLCPFVLFVLVAKRNFWYDKGMTNQEQENKKQKGKLGPGGNSGDEQEFEKLQKFSEELINLGREIEEKFREKQRIKQDVVEKNTEAGKLRMEIFQLTEELATINLELSKLEERRKQLEGR